MEETRDLTDVLNTKDKSAKSGGIKKLVRKVSRWKLSRKNNEMELDKHIIVNSPETGGGAAAMALLSSSEQLADEYRSLLGEHPQLEETGAERPFSSAIPSRYLETTATTWSGLVAKAIGTAEGDDAWRRAWRRRWWTRMELGEGRRGGEDRH
jgi:hypothetical protein